MSFPHAQSAILSMGTATAPYQIDQSRAAAAVADSLDAKPGMRRWLRRLYELSGIATRYTVLPDLAALDLASRYAPGCPLSAVPTTAERMLVYEQNATDIAVAAAEEALQGQVDTVTHLIVVSCTGFFAPGPDLVLAQRLGLRPNVQRTIVGFMGCSAAFNGLRLADQIVAADPEARVLLVAVELCTLHIQPGDSRDDLTSASLFADGAAACLIGTPRPDGEFIAINNFYSGVKPDTESEMAWRIGNYGFNIRLSGQVPRHIGTVVQPALAELLGDEPPPQFWAVHPGGPAIVDRVVESCGLNDDDVQASRDVLRRFGNMSSPTILFVLYAIREQLRAHGEQRSGVAMAFGPGLVTEMVHLTYKPDCRRQLDEESALRSQRMPAVAHVA